MFGNSRCQELEGWVEDWWRSELDLGKENRLTEERRVEIKSSGLEIEEGNQMDWGRRRKEELVRHVARESISRRKIEGRNHADWEGRRKKHGI